MEREANNKHIIKIINYGKCRDDIFIKAGGRVPIIAPGKMYGCITTGNFIPFAPESRGSEMKKHYRNHLNVKVMSESKNLRNKWLHLRLSEAE